MDAIVFAAPCAIAVFGLLYGEAKDNAPIRRFAKPAASLAFICVGLAAGALGSAFGQAILAGLVLCALGDVLLIPRSPKSFLGGMAAFAAGHGAYIAAFLIGGVALTPTVLAATVAAALFAGGMVFWLRRDLKDFALPVIGYSIIISLMVAASVAHWAAGPSPESARLAMAAAAFAVSDVAVARDQFRKREFVNRLWGLPLYYAAQCLFALNV